MPDVRYTMSDTLDVAVIGAGPYGLSIAAHLNRRSVSCHIFGKPMTTWRHQMPEGMLLKSDGFASNLSDPANDHTLRAYCAREGIPYDDVAIPVALKTFVDYACDFQRKLVANVDERSVVGLTAHDDGFELRLEDGQTVRTRRVVVAAGIAHFAHMPTELAMLPLHLVSHSSAYGNVRQFADRDITIVGAGASATELAALLHESGASVRLVVRAPIIRFGSVPSAEPRSRWHRVRRPQSGLGPGIRSKMACELPDIFRFLPATLRHDIVRRHLGPASAWHLRPRVLGEFPIMLGHKIDNAKVVGDRIQLGLQTIEGQKVVVETDHVIAATGYRADIDRFDFIDECLRSRIRVTGKMPSLSRHFECSVPGLFFAGNAAAATFGPLMRFVYGCSFAAQRICARVTEGIPGLQKG
jgi:thioredoxin reductase